MQETKPLSVIIVHYGKSDPLFACLHSLFLNRPEGLLEILVVNNTQVSLGRQLSQMPFVREVWMQKNVGFGSAGNVGAREARGEILFFLNPDTRMLVADTLERLAGRVTDAEKKAGIVGARLVGRGYTRERWAGGRKTRLLDIVKKRIGFSLKDTLSEERELFPVDWVSGAVFCIQKKDFHRLGGFDETFFLYFEDMDLCLRLKSLKKRVYYDGSVPVLHYGGESFSQKSEQKRQYFASQKRYFQKHRPAWENTFLKWLHRIFLPQSL